MKRPLFALLTFLLATISASYASDREDREELEKKKSILFIVHNQMVPLVVDQEKSIGAVFHQLEGQGTLPVSTKRAKVLVCGKQYDVSDKDFSENFRNHFNLNKDMRQITIVPLNLSSSTSSSLVSSVIPEVSREPTHSVVNLVEELIPPPADALKKEESEDIVEPVSLDSNLANNLVNYYAITTGHSFGEAETKKEENTGRALAQSAPAKIEINTEKVEKKEEDPPTPTSKASASGFFKNWNLKDIIVVDLEKQKKKQEKLEHKIQAIENESKELGEKIESLYKEIREKTEKKIVDLKVSLKDVREERKELRELFDALMKDASGS